MIYFLQEAGNKAAPIKIGFTSGSVTARLHSLQIGYPKPLCVLATRAGDSGVERLEHQRWKHLHSNGEWFSAGADLIAYIESLGCEAIMPRRRRELAAPGVGVTDPAIPRPLPCCACGEDVFSEPVLANVEWVVKYEDGVSHISEIRWRHKRCHISKRGWDGWEDIGDLLNPYVFLDFLMTTMNGLQTGGHKFAPQAYEDMKTILLACGARVVRPLTDANTDRLMELAQVSRAFGGLG